MAKKLKKIIFPGTTLLTSLYLSTIFTVGLTVGYLGTNLFYKKFIKTGKVKLIILPFGKWKFHLHHWISGSIIILVIYTTGLVQSPLYLGTLGGIIFHDFYTDKDWYKVIYKKGGKNDNKNINPVRDSEDNKKQ